MYVYIQIYTSDYREADVRAGRCRAEDTASPQRSARPAPGTRLPTAPGRSAAAAAAEPLAVLPSVRPEGRAPPAHLPARPRPSIHPRSRPSLLTAPAPAPPAPRAPRTSPAPSRARGHAHSRARPPLAQRAVPARAPHLIRALPGACAAARAPRPPLARARGAIRVPVARRGRGRDASAPGADRRRQPRRQRVLRGQRAGHPLHGNGGRGRGRPGHGGHRPGDSAGRMGGGAGRAGPGALRAERDPAGLGAVGDGPASAPSSVPAGETPACVSPDSAGCFCLS